MSWILGWLSENLPANASKTLASIHHATPLFTSGNTHLWIEAGGITETLCNSKMDGRYESTDSGWIVCGLGIQADLESSRFLSSHDWQRILATHQFDASSLDGHFVACRWQGGTVEVFSDQLGQRTLYIAQSKNGVFFSTRLDWISQISKLSAVDFHQLGPRWLSFNQFSYQSGVQGIHQLGPAGRGTLTARSIKLDNANWQPEFSDKGSVGPYLSHLAAIAKPVLEESKQISLGLSGGVDSRTLLAVLLAGQSKPNVHVFGDPSDPDVRTALNIARAEGLSSVFFDDPLPGQGECVQLLAEYTSQANLSEPATSIMRLRYFPRIQTDNKLMMDGGFGELSRRQYLNRLRLRGESALKSKDARRVDPFLRISRANIFIPEIQALMETGTIQQLQDTLNGMPAISKIGIGNFLDLLSVRVRIPNWGCHEQARLDCVVLNYMPFVQPSLLRLLFLLPVAKRENGRLFRRLIYDLHPTLARYPFVKGGSTYPFKFNTIQAAIWTRMKARLGICYESNLRHRILHVMMPFVFDTLNSSSVRTYGGYDFTSISKFVSNYYSGDSRLASHVDWWLTFELWRRSLESGWFEAR
jgi:hypothetical protein